jgi:hypothetical protein
VTSEPFQPVEPEPDPLPAAAPPPPSAAPPPSQASTTPPPPAAYAPPPYVPLPTYPVGGARAASGPSRTVLYGVIAVVLALMIGGLGFALGRLTAPHPAGLVNGRIPAGLQFQNGDDGQLRPGNGFQAPGNVGPFSASPGFGVRGFGGGSLQGTVVSMSSTTLTIKLANGQTVDLAITPSTGYHRQSDATAGDVTAGTTVIVNVTGVTRGAQGATGTAGSVTIVP